ncbi:kamA family protein, partial [Vibrio parahaemolyticus V-223/04]
AKPGSFTKRR